MIRGYLSVEWLALCAIGLTASLYLARIACLAPKGPPNLLATGLVVSTGLYLLLRLGGKTPIGIARESQPAARGHPGLSAAAAALSAIAWIAAYVMRS